MERIVHEFDDLAYLIVEILVMGHDPHLRMSTEDLQASLVHFLGLLRRMVTPGVVRPGAPLVVAMHGASDHVDHQVVAREQPVLGQRSLSRQREDLLPLLLREIYLGVDGAAVKEQHSGLCRMQVGEVQESLLLGHLVIQKYALHLHLRRRSRPLGLEAVAVRQEVRGILRHRQHLEAPCAEPVSQESKRRRLTRARPAGKHDLEERLCGRLPSWHGALFCALAGHRLRPSGN
mmetsp:Transcript_79546/g.221322  ORF Transcript_79546/g.221322 Transcript_79546/m.221322 type:complete len:233 (+) Transcript_79546:765-1463(+)